MKWHYTKDEKPTPYDEIILITTDGHIYNGMYVPEDKEWGCVEYYEVGGVDFPNMVVSMDRVLAWVDMLDVMYDYKKAVES